MIFIKKVNFMLFYNFPCRVMENTLVFLPPLYSTGRDKWFTLVEIDGLLWYR